MPNPPAPPKQTGGSTRQPSASVPQIKRVKPGVKRWRVVLNCTQGWGKTTTMAHAPKPLIIMCGRELGFETLREADRVPDCDCIEVSRWPELLRLLRGDMVKDYDTVGIDSAGSIYTMIQKFVLDSQFAGEIDKFSGFGRGRDACEVEWNKLLDAMERTGKNIILASHTETVSFVNAAGDNYLRIIGNLPKGLWAITQHWADAVLYGDFFTSVDKNGKGQGGTDRVLYTEHRAAHDAKNRYGMPDFIEIPSDPTKVFDTIFSHIQKGNK